MAEAMMTERGVAVDHGKLELSIEPIRGFKTMRTAHAMIPIRWEGCH